MGKFRVTKTMRKAKSKAMRESLMSAGIWANRYGQDIVSIYSTRGGTFGTTYTQKSRTLQGYSKPFGR